MTGITIQRLGHQGDGIAQGPVFAARTLPGEVVEGRLEGTRLEDVRILRPSPARVSAPCPHYKACGGCQIMHASAEFQAEWKTESIRSALAAHGLETAIRPIATSPEQSRRRATFAARRTKKGALAGFHGRRSDVVTEVPDCRLLRPAVLETLPLARELAIIGGSRKGALAVAVTEARAGLDVAVTGGKPLDGPLRQSLGAFVAAKGLARLAWEDEVVATDMPPDQSFDGIAVVPPPGAFLQATAEGEAVLRASVDEAVEGAGRVVDLFAGCGTFSLPLARRTEVHAVEGDGAMIRALEKGWRQAEGLRRVTAEARDLFRRPLQGDELDGHDAAVIDPPRAGAEAQVAALAASGIARIAYVSCNPITFARDAKALCDQGFVLEWVQPVDQFRWSTHTELAALLVRG